MGCIGGPLGSLDFAGRIYFVLGSSFWDRLALEENTAQETKLGHYPGIKVETLKGSSWESRRCEWAYEGGAGGSGGGAAAQPVECLGSISSPAVG